MNLGKPWSVRLTEGLGHAHDERTLLFLGSTQRHLWPPTWIGNWAARTRCIALAFNFSFSTYSPAPRKRPKLLFRRPCEPFAILAAARVEATVVLLFATNRRLCRAGTDKQPSDYSARGAIT